MKTTLIALAVLLALPAFAQKAEPGKPVARLKSVDGNVLVSEEAGLASARTDARLAEGSRVITTANAEAVVVYDDGCEIRLKPNQRLEIDTSRPCKARVVQAQTILAEPGGAATLSGAVLAGSVGIGSIAGGLAGLAGMAALANTRQDKSVSPN